MSAWVEMAYLVMCDECSYEDGFTSWSQAEEAAKAHADEHEAVA